MNSAIADLKSSDNPCVAKTAKKYGLVDSTLRRRWKGITTTKDQAIEDRRFLNNQQEQQLIEHIRSLCEKCLPPTPAIVAEIATQLGGRPPGLNWCSRFVTRHRLELDSRYLNSLDLERHHADSVALFEQYFSIVGKKICEYNIQPENTYNMDEKGFLLGNINKAKRIFSKDLKASGKLIGAGQDGSREWITVVATICADGSTLPPLLIYEGSSGSIQDSWIQDFKSNEHDAWFSSSPNGWTSDEIGFKWLEGLFHKKTKDKARRCWRLLFVDGHGSHVTLKFLEWAQKHKILVAIYPPHTTHRLQPLDVGCFAPLATYYSQGLEHHTGLSEGQTRLTKRDFFKNFYPAWHKAFTEKNVISSWCKSGLFPFNPALVVDKLRPRNQKQPLPQKAPRQLSSSPPLCWDSPSALRKLRIVVNQTVDRKAKKYIKRLSDDLLSTKAKLALEELSKHKLTEALRHEKKKRKRGKKLIEQFRAQEGTGAILFSPQKVQAALELQEQREQDMEQLKKDKVLKAQEKAALKLQKEQEAQQKQIDRAVAAAARKEAEALKKAQKAQEKEAKKAQQQLKLDLKAARRRLRTMPKGQPVVLEAVAVVEEPEIAEVPKQPVTRRGRAIKKPVHLLT